MTQEDRRVQINISAIHVAGVGGLGLVAMAGVVATFLPAVRWSMIAGLSGGVLLALALVLARRGRKAPGPSGDDPKILFRAAPAEAQSSTDEGAADRPITRSRDVPIYSTR